MRYLCLLFFLFLSSAAFCQTPSPSDTGQLPSVTLPPDLARVLTDYQQAWAKKDSVALAQLFTEDGIVLSPSRPMVRGREAIEKSYRGAGGPLALRAVAFATEGKLGYIIGGFNDVPNGPDRGKFTLTLRKASSGEWQIMSDMDNGNGGSRASLPAHP